MKLGARQQKMLDFIKSHGFWCYGADPFCKSDAETQQVCESLERKGLLERFERRHPYGFADTTAWRLPAQKEPIL